MKKTINVYDMKDEFIKMNRDYYSFSGLEALLEYYNMINENMELDCVGICGDCTEYGEEAAFSLSDLINDYGYEYTVEEYKQDNNIEGSEYDEIKYIAALVKVLECYTTVLQCSNGNYIVFDY